MKRPFSISLGNGGLTLTTTLQLSFFYYIKEFS